MSVGEPDLLLDEVDAGHHFGDRMLNLNAGVHFHEEEVMVLVEEKFNGADIPVMHSFDGFNRDAADFSPEFFIDGRRRRFFEKLLMPALDRAVSFSEMRDMTTVVGDDLHFDMTGFEKVSFKVDGIVAERALCLRLGRLKGASEIVGFIDDTHTAASPTG